MTSVAHLKMISGWFSGRHAVERVLLDIGVLIIGSLLWDEKRRHWRDARLDIRSAQPVTVPIRYGRLSTSRGNTYTMVFSRLCHVGQGIVVRCTHGVPSSADLLVEAESLWKAEQPSAAAGRIASNWGCVALLSNPERKTAQDVVKAWGERVREEPNTGMYLKRSPKVSSYPAAACCKSPGRASLGAGSQCS